MPTFENTGLRIADVADVHTFLGDFSAAGPEPPNVVRLRADQYDWAAVRAAGAVIRPTWIHWVCAVKDGSLDVLEQQSSKQRQRSRAAVRSLHNLSVEFCEPVDPAVLDEWGAIYAAQVDTMQYGRNMVTTFRKVVLDPSYRHGLLVWRRDGEVVCGVVTRFDLERSALVLRFGAVKAGDKNLELPRAMYVAAADIAAARGMRWLTLGSDVNFYGAVVRPGLCAFKLRLGFRPVPADLFGRGASKDVAERVVSLEGLEPPVLRFEYQRPRESDSIVEDFYEGPAALRLTSVVAAGGESQILDSLPDHRRLLLG